MKNLSLSLSRMVSCYQDSWWITVESLTNIERCQKIIFSCHRPGLKAHSIHFRECMRQSFQKKKCRSDKDKLTKKKGGIRHILDSKIHLTYVHVPSLSSFRNDINIRLISIYSGWLRDISLNALKRKNALISLV